MPGWWRNARVFPKKCIGNMADEINSNPKAKIKIFREKLQVSPHWTRIFILQHKMTKTETSLNWNIVQHSYQTQNILFASRRSLSITLICSFIKILGEEYVFQLFTHQFSRADRIQEQKAEAWFMRLRKLLSSFHQTFIEKYIR